MLVAGPFGFAGLVAGGFLAVYFYQRRTGQIVTIVNGARLGWISGIFTFAMITVLFTFLVVALSQPEMVSQLLDQMTKRTSVSQEDAKRLIDTLRSPSGILTAITFLFLSSTLLPAFGGAVGAKLLSRS